MGSGAAHSLHPPLEGEGRRRAIARRRGGVTFGHFPIHPTPARISLSLDASPTLPLQGRVKRARGRGSLLALNTGVFPSPLRTAHPIRYIEAIECPRVNAHLTGFRHPGTADNEGFSGNADAPLHSRDWTGGRQGPAGCRPHSRRAPAAYLPLRAGWALAPGHSGGSPDNQQPQSAPKQTAGAKREGPFP